MVKKEDIGFGVKEEIIVDDFFSWLDEVEIVDEKEKLDDSDGGAL